MTGPADAAPFAFVGADPCQSPLDRADRLRPDPDALAALWPGARVLVLDAEGRAFAGDDGQALAIDGAGVGGGPGAAMFLGLDGEGRATFAIDAALIAFDAPARTDLRSAASTWPARDAAAFAAARAIQHWRARHRHCGACGGALGFSRGGWVGRCEHCGLEHYPRTDPAVIVAVGEGERLLLGRQATWPARRWSVIAGFVEPGETLEQAVVREVHEETGVRVTACRYLASQPWPFPGALMLGFLAEAEPGDACAGDELEDARWFTRAEIEAALAAEARGEPDAGPFLLPSRISIAHWLVREWLARRVRD
jgi:NAD+ diphosphatase